MTDYLNPQDLANAKVDAKTLGEAVNDKKIIKPRYGDSYKSIPMISADGDFAISELKKAIEIALAAGAGENGWTDKLVQTWSGRTQEFENKRMGRTRLGQRILHENLTTSVDVGSHKYPQGSCKVGSSLFVKVATSNGVVGSNTEEFIIAEYNFETGVLISESQPMQTLGHHELSGYTKGGETYLVTSYQPASDTYGRSGVGITHIQWEGASTSLANATQYELLKPTQFIGNPAVDENGEYVYLLSSYSTLNVAGGSGLLRRSPTLNVGVYKLADVLQGKTSSVSNFDIAVETGNGWASSNVLNGFTADSNYLYVVFGGAYGTTTIAKYSVNGELIERISTDHSRAVRPRSETLTQDIFLYNAEPEAIFSDNGKLYLLIAEAWYGVGEFVRFDGKFYMARYGTTGSSPSSNVNDWEKVPFTPVSFTEYSAATTYTGRNTSVGYMKRVLIETGLKTVSNKELLTDNSIAHIPNMVNNKPRSVHYYGSLNNGNQLNFGQYDNKRQTWQINASISENSLNVFDTRYSNSLNNKYSSFMPFLSGTQERLSIRPIGDDDSTRLDLFGTTHNSSYKFAGLFISLGKTIVEFYKDGKFVVNSSSVDGVITRFRDAALATIVGVEKDSSGFAHLTTIKNKLFFGLGSGADRNPMFGIDFVSKNIIPNNDGEVYNGTRNNKWRQVCAKDLILQPSAYLLPVKNGELVVEATSDTTVTIKLKGTDGVIRSVALTLA